MLYNGKIVAVGTPEELIKSDNQIVQQFIHGRAEGPIKEW
jgi:phospholipid/cholesterol/gamma-HCH transport system ATP-binding protein